MRVVVKDFLAKDSHGKLVEITLCLDSHNNLHRIAAWVTPKTERGEEEPTLYYWDPILEGTSLILHEVDRNENTVPFRFKIQTPGIHVKIRNYIKEKRQEELAVVEIDWATARKKAEDLGARAKKLREMMRER